MNENDPTIPPEITPASCPISSETAAKQARRPRVRRVRSSRQSRWILAAAVMVPVIGLSAGFAETPLASAAQLASGSAAAGGPRSGSGASNARSGPASGGAAGTVKSTSKSSFVVTTSAGQKVTIVEASSTKFKKGNKSTSVHAVTKGTRVLVLGTTSGTTIKAALVIVQTTGGSGSATSTAAKVIPFQRGAPTTSKQVGQTPANWSQGSGTIVSGTAANKATEAALAAYPGGIIDRVVRLSNGEYNVHVIGVNWPHHVFLNEYFKVIGAL